MEPRNASAKSTSQKMKVGEFMYAFHAKQQRRACLRLVARPAASCRTVQGCIRRKNTGGLVGITGTRYGLAVPLAVAYQFVVKLPVRLV